MYLDRQTQAFIPCSISLIFTCNPLMPGLCHTEVLTLVSNGMRHVLYMFLRDVVTASILTTQVKAFYIYIHIYIYILIVDLLSMYLYINYMYMHIPASLFARNLCRVDD